MTGQQARDDEEQRETFDSTRAIDDRLAASEARDDERDHEALVAALRVYQERRHDEFTHEWMRRVVAVIRDHAALHISGAMTEADRKPESTSWRDAKPGEVWQIFRIGIGEGTYLRAHHEWRAIWPFTGSASPASSLDHVSCARRIWPVDGAHLGDGEQ